MEKDYKETLYLIIDFETCTPKGRSSVPIELGYALFGESGVFLASGNFLFGLPDDVRLTFRDVNQTGITEEMLMNKPEFSKDVFSICMSEITKEIFYRYRMVAQNARYEAGILKNYGIKGWGDGRLLDTMIIAKEILPSLGSYKLDVLAEYFQIPIPPDRHHAEADCLLTGKVLLEEKKLSEEQNKNWSEIMEKSVVDFDVFGQLSLF